LKFLVAWPNWGRRQDRGIMFSHLAEWIDEVYLISGVEPPPTMRAQMHPRCRVISVGEGGDVMEICPSCLPMGTHAARTGGTGKGSMFSFRR
jgi:hypothetical protein